MLQLFFTRPINYSKKTKQISQKEASTTCRWMLSEKGQKTEQREIFYKLIQCFSVTRSALLSEELEKGFLQTDILSSNALQKNLTENVREKTKERFKVSKPAGHIPVLTSPSSQ